MDKPESEVEVLVSLCTKCKCDVTVAIKNLLDKKETKKFYKEARKFNLDINTISLVDYRSLSSKYEYQFCKCK